MPFQFCFRSYKKYFNLYTSFSLLSSLIVKFGCSIYSLQLIQLNTSKLHSNKIHRDYVKKHYTDQLHSCLNICNMCCRGKYLRIIIAIDLGTSICGKMFFLLFFTILAVFNHKSPPPPKKSYLFSIRAFISFCMIFARCFLICLEYIN